MVELCLVWLIGSASDARVAFKKECMRRKDPWKGLDKIIASVLEIDPGLVVIQSILGVDDLRSGLPCPVSVNQDAPRADQTAIVCYVADSPLSRATKKGICVVLRTHVGTIAVSGKYISLERVLFVRVSPDNYFLKLLEG